MRVPNHAPDGSTRYAGHSLPQSSLNLTASVLHGHTSARTRRVPSRLRGAQTCSGMCVRIHKSGRMPVRLRGVRSALFNAVLCLCISMSTQVSGHLYVPNASRPSQTRAPSPGIGALIRGVARTNARYSAAKKSFVDVRRSRNTCNEYIQRKTIP